MYFKDLSHYSFKLPFSLANVLNVGWLDAQHDFPSGEIDGNFVSQLTAAIELRIPGVDPHVNLIRGIHPCNICGTEEILIRRNNRPFFLGMSELWIPYESLWLAAPSMLLHYIEKHRYIPPTQFIDAVTQLDTAAPYKGQDIYDHFVETEMSRLRAR